MILWSETSETHRAASPGRVPAHGSRDAVETAIGLSKERKPHWETVITKREPRKYGVKLRPRQDAPKRKKS